MVAFNGPHRRRLGGMVDDVLEVTRSRGGLSLRWPLACRCGILCLRRLVVLLQARSDRRWHSFHRRITSGAVLYPFLYAGDAGAVCERRYRWHRWTRGRRLRDYFHDLRGDCVCTESNRAGGFRCNRFGSGIQFPLVQHSPARFYLTETGSMALTLALSVTAFSTDVLGKGVGVFVLPIIALPLTLTVVTNLLQVFWKKVFHKKLFKIAPIHHHFEAMGWPPYKVTMRYWIVTIMAGIFGLALALLK